LIFSRARLFDVSREKCASRIRRLARPRTHHFSPLLFFFFFFFFRVIILRRRATPRISGARYFLPPWKRGKLTSREVSRLVIVAGNIVSSAAVIERDGNANARVGKARKQRPGLFPISARYNRRDLALRQARLPRDELSFRGDLSLGSPR